ncbi:unnamed protein product [Caenorhabditis brenneri]
MSSAKNKEESTILMINMLHLIGFAILLIPLVVVYVKWLRAKLKVTNYSPLFPVTHFFIVVLYMCNPWIIEYREKAYSLDVDFRMFKNDRKGSSQNIPVTINASIISFFFYVSLTVPSWYIKWKMSEVKPDYDGDEPYLVIYGGEGSVTKKLQVRLKTRTDKTAILKKGSHRNFATPVRTQELFD